MYGCVCIELIWSRSYVTKKNYINKFSYQNNKNFVTIIANQETPVGYINVVKNTTKIT